MNWSQAGGANRPESIGRKPKGSGGSKRTQCIISVSLAHRPPASAPLISPSSLVLALVLCFLRLCRQNLRIHSTGTILSLSFYLSLAGETLVAQFYTLLCGQQENEHFSCEDKSPARSIGTRRRDITYPQPFSWPAPSPLQPETTTATRQAPIPVPPTPETTAPRQSGPVGRRRPG